MGRHSSPNQGHFYRSFAGWVFLWAVIATVTGAAVWFIVAALGGPSAQRPVAAASDKNEKAAPAPTVSGIRIAATPEPSETPEAAETPDPVPSATATQEPSEEVELITEGISVQVLNGTAAPAAGQTMAERLAQLGFEIVAVEESSRGYDQTTVFWSSDATRDAATALAERHGWVAEPKPANLSDEVSLHVVVGSDEI